MKTRLALIVIAILLTNAAIYAQDYHEIINLAGPLKADGAHVGQSVSISGNYAIAGGDTDSWDESGNNYVYTAGTAYIFERDINGNWNEGQKIIASDRGAADHFGISVCISGNYAIVGAYSEDEDASGENTLSAAGSAYIFKRDESGAWNEVQKIVASDRNESDHFGISVSISDNRAIVGAYVEDEDTSGTITVIDAGSAYIFEKDESGTWNEIKKLVAPDRGVEDKFGRSVSISGNYAIVGAEREDEDVSGENTLTTAGSAYIFETDDRGYWNKVQKIVASERAEGDFFGKSVSISGNKAIVAAYASDEESKGSTLFDAGSAYLYERDESGKWNEVKKIVAADKDTGDGFGTSVGISGDYAVVGASGKEGIREESTISFAGAAYIFKRNGNGNWNEVQKIVASDRDTADFFGEAVAISRDYIIVGAIYDDWDNNKAEPVGDHGSAYIFETCSQEPENDPDNIIENGDFEICNASPWYLYLATWLDVTSDIVIFQGKGVVIPFSISIAEEPLEWHIQMNQMLTEYQKGMLEIGANYRLSFEASAEVENRYIQVFFGNADDPWQPQVAEEIWVSTESETYTYDFALSELYDNMRLTFQLGTETPWIAFDNVKLEKKVIPPSGVMDTYDSNKIRIIPNPATDYVELFVNEGSTITMINSLGQIVLTAKTVSSEFILQTTEFENGIYIIIVQKDNKVNTAKIIVQ